MVREGFKGVLDNDPKNRERWLERSSSAASILSGHEVRAG